MKIIQPPEGSPVTKVCTKCGEDKELGEYNAAKHGKYGRASECKGCMGRYRSANKKKIAEYLAKYRAANKERAAARDAKYRAANKEKVTARIVSYMRRRRQSDPAYALTCRTRLAVRRTLNGTIQGASRHLPYTPQQLYDHLLSTLPEGYTEADICDGSKLHIDHIRPVSSFNLTGEIDDEFLACWALENLQLLPAAENLAKSNSLDWNKE